VIAAHDDVTAEATSAAGAIVSYTSPATSDAVDGPGVAACLPASGSPFALGDTTVTCTADDAAGNHAEPSSFVVHVVDTTPPDTTILTQPATPTIATTATFTFTGSDVVTAPADLTFACALDGGAFAPCTSPAAYTGLSEGSHTFHVLATDAAHNTDGSAATFTWTVDLTAPAVTLTVGTPDGSNGWFTTSPVTVSVAATDPSHVVDITCTVDGSAAAVGGLAGVGTGSASGTLQVNGDGTHGVLCTATDGVGNSGASGAAGNSATVKIDTTAPVIALASRLPAANANGWNKEDVTVTWACSDTTSGVVAGGDSETVGTEGAGQSAVGTCADQAGNAATHTVNGIAIDKTAPTIAPGTPPAGSPYLLNQVVAASFTCNDTLSGYASSGGTAANGPNTTDCSGATHVNTSSVGSGSYAMTATDRAGNQAALTASYTVQFRFAGFFAPVENDVLNGVQAGRAIPMKWQLLDAAGTPVLSLATVKTLGFTQIACAAEAVENPIAGDADTTGASGLRIVGAEYQFNWQTAKNFANLCMEFRVTFTDDTTQSARFKFKK
jgi:hypothetical protein